MAYMYTLLFKLHLVYIKCMNSECSAKFLTCLELTDFVVIVYRLQYHREVRSVNRLFH